MTSMTFTRPLRLAAGIATIAVALWLPAVGQAADNGAPQPAEKAATPAPGTATPAKCLEAAVNPVTGFAVCVNPAGAPVDQPAPPSQPCKPRAHDKDIGTVYEHWSAC